MQLLMNPYIQNQYQNVRNTNICESNKGTSSLKALQISDIKLLNRIPQDS